MMTGISLTLILPLCLVGWFLLWRVPLCRDGREAEASASVSIIIPARNEELNLPALLNSIHALSSPPLEVIVVDDASTDDTPRIAKNAGAQVVHPPPLPDGWRGKTWACHHGAGEANGEILLFLDADTRLHPDALTRMQTEALAKGVLSLAPFHRVEKLYEQFSGFFNLLTLMGMGAFGLRQSPDRSQGLFGPVLWIDRASYHAIGGHEAVRNEILEHMSMCPLLTQQGLDCRVRGGRGVVDTRMYPNGFQELVEGWTKAFASGAGKSAPGTLLGSSLWITGGFAAFFATVFGLLLPIFSLWLSVSYLVFALVLLRCLRKVGSFSMWAALAYPLLLIAFVTLFARSSRLQRSGGSVRWKDREIAAPESEGNP